MQKFLLLKLLKNCKKWNVLIFSKNMCKISKISWKIFHKNKKNPQKQKISLDKYFFVL